MKDFWDIFKRNFFSPIVIAILTLAIILLILNDPRDAWFISVVIIINTFLAIVQETRAKIALKKLELMNAPVAHLIGGDGSATDVPIDKLVVGDMVQLRLGDEVPADGVIVNDGNIEVDESILTGESVPVEKAQDSIVYAASAVVSGSATMRVTKVGADTKVGSMSAVLKRYVPQLTPIQQAIAHAITWLTWGALALAMIIIIVYSLSGISAVQIFKTIVSSAVTLVPEGLLLASSLLLAFGAIRLAQAKVLPQKLSAIEAMALLDVLCVDKTGTLTSDKISFEKFIRFDDSIDCATELVGVVSKETDSGSSTNKAIMLGMPAPKSYKVLETLAFSSERKLSGVKTIFNKKTYSILAGAPEYIEKLASISNEDLKQVQALSSVGKRVLLAATFENTGVSLKDLKDRSGKVLGAIVLSNELRTGLKRTVSFLQGNGVSLRVISGDNPDTVRYIAGEAGINNHDHVMSGAQLQKVSDKDWDSVVEGTTVFARVLPEQKERIIETFERLGNYTGMVGDGVNDALAIKKSNLGVAMYSGAAVTRRVSDIVLLNNSFNALPIGMKLGNRIIQAIELIASLFFHKIIFGVVLLLATLSFGLVYPFLPRHITFLNILLVTAPTIMWTLFPPLPKHRLSPKYFWKDTLLAVAPIAALSGLVITIVYKSLLFLHPNDIDGVLTTTVIVTAFFGVYMVFLAPIMYDVINTKKARFARLLYTVAIIIVVGSSFGFGFTRDFFDFTTPAWQQAWPLMINIITVALLQFALAHHAGQRIKRRERLANSRTS
jgi:cation-transporting ATPase E